MNLHIFKAPLCEKKQTKIKKTDSAQEIKNGAGLSEEPAATHCDCT